MDLSWNQIGSEGIKDVADILEKRTVSNHFLNYDYLDLPQYLNTLNLQVNEIGVQGTSYLAKALAKNRVRLHLSSIHQYFYPLYYKKDIDQFDTRLESYWNRWHATSSRCFEEQQRESKMKMKWKKISFRTDIVHIVPWTE